MKKVTSFHSDAPFYGDKYFTYGLARSGEFTNAQVTLLETHGVAYEALNNGLRQPLTKEETQFLEVCQGLREPETEHEKVWAIFKRKVSNRRVVSAFGTSSSKKRSNTTESMSEPLEYDMAFDDD